ncbi:putative bifunctional diguanylate cyclase/phosphodiesterase [Arenimonas fontis]|nr:bifunctional diguanylate cyclase/phosphodiesterase [Arenimonas fontis]
MSLPSRAERHTRVERLLAEAGQSGTALGLLMVGMAGLRQFNIQHGYERGERLLAEVERQLRAALRPGDQVLARAPGEWLVLLPGLRDTPHAQLAAARLLRQFEQPVEVMEQPVLVDLAVGIAAFPEQGRDAETLCRLAEAALVSAQELADRMAVAPERAPGLEVTAADLRLALAEGHLQMHLQPIWDLRAERICGAEALARWMHPRLGQVSPKVFVPIAEASGLVSEFTRWSLNAAMQHAARLAREGLVLPVSVNLSAAALAERGIVEQVLAAMALWNVPPPMLVVEVTETAIIADPDGGAGLLRRLGEAGVRVAIDDFGVGNASFAYLRQFPAGELKMDGSFITGMLGDMRGQQLVRAMVEFSHHLGMQVVAECVEDRATLGALAAMDCDFAQGFVIGRPAPVEALLESLAAV